MKKDKGLEWQAPELVSLNNNQAESQGVCSTGSGNGTCNSGGAAGGVCDTGTGAGG